MVIGSNVELQDGNSSNPEMDSFQLDLRNPWEHENATVVKLMGFQCCEFNKQEAGALMTPLINAMKMFWWDDVAFRFNGRILELLFPVIDNKCGDKYTQHLFSAMRPGGEVIVVHTNPDFSVRSHYLPDYLSKFLVNLTEIIPIYGDNDTDGIDALPQINYLEECLACILMRCYSADSKIGLANLVYYRLDYSLDQTYYALA